MIVYYAQIHLIVNNVIMDILLMELIVYQIFLNQHHLMFGPTITHNLLIRCLQIDYNLILRITRMVIQSLNAMVIHY